MPFIFLAIGFVIWQLAALLIVAILIPYWYWILAGLAAFWAASLFVQNAIAQSKAR